MGGLLRKYLSPTPSVELDPLSPCTWIPAHLSPPPLPVRYRVFALDQKMRPSTDTITVTVEVSPRPLAFLILATDVTSCL